MKLTRNERIFLSIIKRGDERNSYSVQELDDLAKRGLVKIHECADGDYVTVTDAGRAALAQGCDV